MPGSSELHDRLRARDARPDDYATFTRMFAELKIPDPVPPPERFEREIAPHAILLEDGASPVAYGWFFSLKELGRVIHVVVAPEARGRGVGRALMGEIARRLRMASCTRWTLNVKPDNLPAIRLYERTGMSVQHESCAMHVAWSDVARLPEGPRGVVAVAIAPDGSEDAVLERTFAFGEGRLALLRGSEARVLLRLRDPATPGDVTLGAGVFDPGFPGASPFGVRSPDLARALLSAMRPHARPEHHHLSVFVEGSPALAATFAAAGAVTHQKVLRMEGLIPGP
jgi:GNAT superfamily N-acetyltransferase